MSCFLIRFIFIFTKNISVDESALLFISKYPLFEIVNVMRSCGEVHPPLYFFFCHFWQMLGNSEWILRLSSVIFSSLSVPLIWLLTFKMSKSEKISYLATILYCISAFDIEFACEFRMYSCLTFLFLSAIYTCLKYLDTEANKYLITNIIIGLIGVSVHFLFIFCILAELIIYLINKKIKYSLYQLIPISLFFYYFFTIKSQDMTIRETPDMWHLVMLFSKMLVGEGFLPGCEFYKISDPWDEPVLVFGGIGLLFFIPCFLLYLDKSKYLLVILSSFFIPIFLLSCFTNIKIFEYKYFVVMVPFVIITISILAVRLTQSMNFTLIFLLIFIPANIFSSISFFYDPYFKGPNWKATAQFIENNCKEDELAIVFPSMMSLPVDYYLKNKKPLLPANKIDENFVKIASGFKNIWFCSLTNHPYTLKEKPDEMLQYLYIEDKKIEIESRQKKDTISITKYQI